jgi:glycosyltransferase involved in cell wall biosynthesis
MLRAGRTFGEPLDWTFYSVLPRPGRFDEEARRLGATVINSPVELDDKMTFVRHLRATLRSGRYDVLHCHHDVVSAVYLIAALGLPIARRIVHVHNADLHVPTGSRNKAALVREPMRRICLWAADRIVGISNYTLSTFLNGQSPRSGRDAVLYYGIDTKPFHAPPRDRQQLLRSLNLPDKSRIVLFVGRMVSYKNPLFVVEMLAALLEGEPNGYAVFVGTGPLTDETITRAKELNIGNRVRVLGWRDDTVQLMQLSDLFVFPRIEEVTADLGMEGLGLVVVEAQAAGLTSLLSLGIPEDAIVVSEICERRSVHDGASAWGGAARELLARPRPDRGRALAAIERSRFSLEAGFRNLVSLHQL